MAQVVRRRPLTEEGRVHAQDSPCRICAGQNGTGTMFSQFLGFSCQYHSTVARRIGDEQLKDSLTPST
jgi:hypothetical protein